MKKEKSILVEEVTKAFGECFYSQPIFIQELPTQVLYITIKGEQEVAISDRAATETNKDVAFQGTADFQPFFSLHFLHHHLDYMCKHCMSLFHLQLCFVLVCHMLNFLI